MEDRILTLRYFIKAALHLPVFLGFVAVLTEGVSSSRQREAERLLQAGIAATRSGDHTLALADFSKSIELDPANSQCFLARGRLFLYSNPPIPEKAIDDLNQALRLQPGFAKALLDRAYAFEKIGDFVAATRDIDDAVRLAPHDAEGYRLRGQILRRQGKLDLAVAEYTRAIQLEPKLGSALEGRASVYLTMHALEKAHSDCAAAIRLAPRDSYLHCLMAQILFNERDEESGFRALGMAIALSPEDPRAYWDRARAYRMRGDFDKAIDDYGTLLRLTSAQCRYATSGLVLLERGSVYADNGEFEKAITDFTEAIRLDPKFAPAYSNRGNAYGSEGQFDKEIADCTEAIRLDPKLAAAYLNRGLAYAGKGNPDLAVKDCDAAVRLCPESPCFYEIRGAMRIRRGDFTGGIADLQTEIRLNPNDPATKLETALNVTIAPEALRFGEEQVRHMLRDRPVMAKLGERAAVLYRWAARKFAGEDLRLRVRWDASEPDAADADSHWPTMMEEGRIRIRTTHFDGENKGKEQSFDAMWSEAVFELYNIAKARDFQLLELEATSGKLGKQTYVTRIIECESCAAERTRAFYIRIFLPWAKEEHVSTDPKSWGVGLRLDCRENLLLRNVNQRQPYWKYYSRQHDTLLLSALVAKRENEKAIELATQMQKQATNGKQKIMICFERGLAYWQKGDYDNAIADYSEAIRLDPNDAEAYGNRGLAHASKGETDKAIADYTEAIRLDPKNCSAYYNRGDAYKQKGETGNANADFVKAKKLGYTD